jgi:hypothetical protein
MKRLNQFEIDEMFLKAPKLEQMNLEILNPAKCDHDWQNPVRDLREFANVTLICRRCRKAEPKKFF